MTSAIPPVLIELQADVASLKTGLQKAQDAIKGVDDSVKTASTGMSNFMGKIKQVGATMGVAFAGTQVVQFGKDVLMAASDMNESLSKINVVFGENSAAVTKWADTSATAMGMSKQSALEAAGTYGNLFQAFGLGQGESQKMSTSLVQLASDMASFNNTSIDDAILALRSGLSGETEPLKRFGVALSDTRLKTEAFSLGLIKSTNEALTPAAKAQASYSLIMKDTTLAQGDFARTSDGTANTMRIVAAQMQNAKAALGQALLPAFQGLLLVLKPIIAGLAAFGKFMAENKEVVATFAAVIGVATVAWGVYTAVIKRAAIQQAIFNAIAAINPFVAIVIGIAALAAGLVYAWKHSETFRKVVVEVAKGVLTYISFMIKAWGQMIEIILKVVTGPLQLFLGVLSKLPGVGGAAKKGLELIHKGIDGVGNFADSAASKVDSFKSKLDGLASKTVDVKVNTKGGSKGGSGGGSGGGGGGLSAEEIKQQQAAAKQRAKDIEAANKEVIKIHDKMSDVIDAGNKKMAEAAAKRDKAIVETKKKYADLELKIIEKKKEELAKNEAAWNKAYAKAREDRAKRDAAIEDDYAKKKIELAKAAEDKIADVRKSAAEKQAGIVQQSIDRLRSAFASGTAASISQIFKDGAKTADDVIAQLKSKLTAAKELQKNAAALQAAGYSQTFIEEVVAAGPQIGNEMASALLNASTETQTELKSLYGEVNTISAHGVDDLAKTMNAGGKLATEELMAAFKQVAIDLDASIADINENLKASLEQANKDYLDKMADSKAILDEALKAADEALAEANAATMKEFNDAMKENAANLAEALAAIQSDYEETIAAIAADTKEKLAELQKDLLETANTLKKLGEAKAAAAALANSPATNYVPPTGGRVDMSGNVEYYNADKAKALGAVYNYNTTVTGVDMSDPAATAKLVDNAVRFGSTQGLSVAQKGMAVGM